MALMVINVTHFDFNDPHLSINFWEDYHFTINEIYCQGWCPYAFGDDRH